MSQYKLPIYTNQSLSIGHFYTTVEVGNNYYPVGEVVDLVSDTTEVVARGVVTDTYTTKFDLIGSDELRNMANIHMQSWTNAAEYFINRFGSQFSYDGDVQIITFEVNSAISFDPDNNLDEQEKELGIPDDFRLGIVEQD